jgi:hypothetical protein
MNKKRLAFYLAIILSSLLNLNCRAQTPSPASVDSFRNVIVEGFNFNEKISIIDTYEFAKQGIYSFVNYDQTSTFHDIFLCYENGYNREKDPPLTFVTVQNIRMIRDIRWVFLYYLDQYVLRSRSNSNKVTKSSRIAVLDIKKDDYIPIYGEEGFDNVIKLYQALIIAMNKKTFFEDVIITRKVSLLEFIGYRWEVTN